MTRLTQKLNFVEQSSPCLVTQRAPVHGEFSKHLHVSVVLGKGSGQQEIQTWRLPWADLSQSFWKMEWGNVDLLWWCWCASSRGKQLHTQSLQIHSLALKNIPDLHHQFLLPILKVQIVMASAPLSSTETLRRLTFFYKLSCSIDSQPVILFIKFPTTLQSVSPAASCSVTYVMAMFNGKHSFLLNNGRYAPLKNPILQFGFASHIPALRNRLWGTTLEPCCGKDRLLFLRDV